MNQLDKYVWFDIFLRLHPKHNKILRKVCKDFYVITNNPIFLRQQLLKYIPGVYESEQNETVDLELNYQNLLKKRNQYIQNFDDEGFFAGELFPCTKRS